MLFDFSFETQDYMALSLNLPFRQYILCLFGSGSSLFTYEDILNHDRELRAAVRSLDPSRTYQEACDEYERLLEQRRHGLPTTAVALRMLLLRDLGQRWPNIVLDGFDMGVMLSPNTESNRLLDGAEITYAFFPRETPGVSTESVWPMMESAPCTMTIQADRNQNAF